MMLKLNANQIKIILNAVKDYGKNNPEDMQNHRNRYNKLWNVAKKYFFDLTELQQIDHSTLESILYEQYIKNLEGPTIKYKRNIREFIPIFKEAITYLVESTDPLEEKYKSVLSNNGRYVFPEFKKQFWSPIFAAFYPKECPNFNSKTEKGLQLLGVNFRKINDLGERYKIVIQSFKELAQLDPSLDYLELDHLMHYMVSVPEGQALVEKLIPIESDEFLENPFILLKQKRQIIFYGPPGTGKTYQTKQLAIHFLDNDVE